MMKVSVLLLVLSACSLSMVSAQQTSGPAGTSQSEVASEKKEPAKRPIKLPAEIKLILEVEELPGRENPKSFWEAGYEIRIVDWRAIVERTRTGGDVGDAGLLLLQSSFAHRSLSEENRRLAVALPVNGSLLERLKQQPQNPQAFSLRSTVRLYDAQLDRNYAFKVDRVWQFKLFP